MSNNKHPIEIVMYHHEHGTDVWLCHPDKTTQSIVHTILDWVVEGDQQEDAVVMKSLLTLIANDAFNEAIELWSDTTDECFEVRSVSKNDPMLRGLQLDWRRQVPDSNHCAALAKKILAEFSEGDES